MTRLFRRWLATGRSGPSLRGRTSPLAWTRRLRTLAIVWLVLQALVALALAALHPIIAIALSPLSVPLVLDLALAVTAPIERRMATPYVTKATERLNQVAPTVVAITGSYGKTSTKGVLAHLLAGTRPAYATPASFNNRAGVARAINEGLTPGTQVFIAEMGTYGKGEIADLCAWCPPEIAIITAIGPVHLERFRTEDAIVEAKSEILDGARVGVLNVDDPRLLALADARVASGLRIVRVSASDQNADVAVVPADQGRARVWIGRDDMGEIEQLSAAPGNAACALAAALELGVPRVEAVRRLASAPVAAHRLEVALSDSGVSVLDDTFNANPAGARRALAALRAAGSPSGKRVLVTPGMIELGPRAEEENEAFAREAAQIATTLVIVGRTNRRTLAAGAWDGRAEVVKVGTREEAVEWVRANLGQGDAVLYENDLPDHYP